MLLTLIFLQSFKERETAYEESAVAGADAIVSSNSHLIVRLFLLNFLSEKGPRNVRLYFPYRQYTNLFIFRFVSQHYLCSTLRLFQMLYVVYINV